MFDVVKAHCYVWHTPYKAMANARSYDIDLLCDDLGM
jgi:hypothetical protein